MDTFNRIIFLLATISRNTTRPKLQSYIGPASPRTFSAFVCLTVMTVRPFETCIRLSLLRRVLCLEHFFSLLLLFPLLLRHTPQGVSCILRSLRSLHLALPALKTSGPLFTEIFMRENATGRIHLA